MRDSAVNRTSYTRHAGCLLVMHDCVAAIWSSRLLCVHNSHVSYGSLHSHPQRGFDPASGGFQYEAKAAVSHRKEACSDISLSTETASVPPPQDFLAGELDDKAQSALAHLRESAPFCRVLGSYARDSTLVGPISDTLEALSMGTGGGVSVESPRPVIYAKTIVTIVVIDSDRDSYDSKSQTTFRTSFFFHFFLSRGVYQCRGSRCDRGPKSCFCNTCFCGDCRACPRYFFAEERAFNVFSRRLSRAIPVFPQHCSKFVWTIVQRTRLAEFYLMTQHHAGIQPGHQEVCGVRVGMLGGRPPPPLRTHSRPRCALKLRK